MFGRLITAIVTPFDDQMALDLELLPHLIDHLIDSGTTAVVVSGTTGESPTLSREEKLRLFTETVRLCAGRIPVLAGTGANSTQETIRFTRAVDQLGVDGFLLVAPYYNKPSQEGIYRHFVEAAQATDKPIIVYNIPSRTGVNVQVETMLRLAQVQNIIGMKESSGDFTQISRLIGETADDFFVYSGDDKFLLPVLALGGHGVISVASHVVGNAMTELIEAVGTGDLSRAQSIHHALMPLFEGLFLTSNPVLVKSALNMLDVPVGGVRLPLVDATTDERWKLRKILEQLLNLETVH